MQRKLWQRQNIMAQCWSSSYLLWIRAKVNWAARALPSERSEPTTSCFQLICFTNWANRADRYYKSAIKKHSDVMLIFGGLKHRLRKIYYFGLFQLWISSYTFVHVFSFCSQIHCWSLLWQTYDKLGVEFEHFIHQRQVTNMTLTWIVRYIQTTL